MRWKISAFLIVAILALSMVATAQNSTCWDPCGTKVVQCDQDNTFALEAAYPANIVLSEHGTYYIDLTPTDNSISVGDVRISWYHTNYGPNTMVGVDDSGGDAGDDIVETLDHPVVCYLDIDDDGFDLQDPVYFDMDYVNSSYTPKVSRGDIRVTASPAMDVYNENDVLVYAAGEFGANWTKVVLGDEDLNKELNYIGSGNLSDLTGYVDSDCDGEWSEGDKLYLNQYHEGLNSHFDDFVTIGDVRLYIPLDDECVDDCGTKVVEGDFDATYALIVFNGTLSPQIGTFNDVEVYLDMDHDSKVSIGDIRLSSVSTVYDPNTKVGECDYFDLGHQLVIPSQTGIIKYYDFDDNGNYSLTDPIYIDLDNDSAVSGGDIRLCQVPLENTTAYTAGEIGMQWSVVVAGPGVVDEEDAGWALAGLPDATGQVATVWELLGYIDSDCSNSWTCVDKLYLQQMVLYDSDGNHTLSQNNFSTIGDLRLYVPPEAIEEEDWYDCGTKVMMCSRDVTHALYWWEFMPDLDLDVGFFDKNDNNKFDVGEAAYIDMDGDGEVSIGDIRLTEAICKYTNYSANTKVLDQHAEDLEHSLNFGPVNGNGNGFGHLFFVDLNDNDAYDVTDPLYIETDNSGSEDSGPSPGDIRLTQVPVVDCVFGEAGSIGEAFSQVELADADTEWLFYHYADPYQTNTVENCTFIFDVDCSGDWTCSDILYLNQITEAADINHSGFVTAGDLRLYVPEEYISGETPEEPEYNPYDENEDCIIEMEEMMAAIEDWQEGSLSMEDMLEIIGYWRAGTPYC
jgi:hypothetical protein